MDAELSGKVCLPAAALLAGGLLCCFEGSTRTAGKLMVYFGAQTGMNLYMKDLLSDVLVSDDLQLRGMPASFLVTAVQQIMVFGLLCGSIILSWRTPFKYAPKQLTTGRDWSGVLCLAFAFALNIGLNNYSLELLAVSLNLIIRACLPLSTFALQAALSYFQPSELRKPTRLTDIALMLVGAACAVAAVYAESQLSARSEADAGSDSECLGLGVLVAVLSTFAGSATLALAGCLGSVAELNPIDTACYVSLPCAIFLTPPVFLVAHPVAWPDSEPMTDWTIFLRVLSLSPRTLGLVALSGFLALGYNVLTYSIVQTLSATHTAFAGNFNKAATVALSLLCGFEERPEGVWGFVLCASVCGNICAFAAYSSSAHGGGEPRSFSRVATDEGECECDDGDQQVLEERVCRLPAVSCDGCFDAGVLESDKAATSCTASESRWAATVLERSRLAMQVLIGETKRQDGADPLVAAVSRATKLMQSPSGDLSPL